MHGERCALDRSGDIDLAKSVETTQGSEALTEISGQLIDVNEASNDAHRGLRDDLRANVSGIWEHDGVDVSEALPQRAGMVTRDSDYVCELRKRRYALGVFVIVYFTRSCDGGRVGGRINGSLSTRRGVVMP